MRTILLMLATVCGITVLPDRMPVECVDQMEVNHVYERHTGNHIFTQVIYWKLYPGNGLFDEQFVPVGYHICEHQKANFPVKVGELWKFRADYYNNQGKRQIITVLSRSLKVSHTMMDPEREASKKWEDRDYQDIPKIFMEKGTIPENVNSTSNPFE